MTGDVACARELADSLYAELFGMPHAIGDRIPKLNSYTGRGSLEGWLRTVLAQQFVNRLREQRRFTALDEAVTAAPIVTSNDHCDERLDQAMKAALKALCAEDRLLLKSYYLDDRTLAEIAGMVAMHESTVSRRIHKINSRIRKQVYRELRAKGISRSEVKHLIDDGLSELASRLEIDQ
jgi:RNA polymerase sigma-70 factor (ECF subfamily)